MATITASYLHLVARHVAERGVRTQALLRAIGIADELGGSERRVTIAQLYDLWSLAARTLADPSLPVSYAQGLRIEDHHVLGFAVMCAANGREAIRTLIRYSRIASDSGAWALEETADSVRLVWQRSGPRTLGHRIANEAALCEVIASVRQIFPGCEPLELSLRHAAPSATRAHRRFVGAPIRWGAADDAVRFEPALLRRRPASENPALMAYFESEAERRRAALTPSTLADQVAHAIVPELAAGGPTPAVLARRLGLSASRLREQLRQEGTSYRALVDRARRERAEELLRADQQTVSEIALALGFSETSAFTRAHRRWHGVPPRRHRDRGAP